MIRRRIVVVGAMIEQAGKYLITQRSPEASLPMLWEFPGGRVEEGENDRAAVTRELMERLGIGVEVGPQVMHVTHSYPDYDIDFRVFRCAIASGEVERTRIHDFRWVAPSELDQYQFPAADQKTFELLLGLRDG